MNCRDCQTVLSEYAEGLLPGEQRGDVDQHLEACPTCRLELQAESQLVQALQTQPLKTPPADFTRRVLARAHPVPRPAMPPLLVLLAYASSVAALAVGMYQVLGSLGKGLGARLPGAPEWLSGDGLPSAGGQVLAVPLQGVGSLGDLLTAGLRELTRIPIPAADISGLSPTALLCGGSVVGLVVLSAILYATLRTTRASI